jgi:hypothetical protein
LLNDDDHPVTVGERLLVKKREQRLAQWHHYLESLRTRRW